MALNTSNSSLVTNSLSESHLSKSPLTALSASASAISNVGPGIGESIGPLGNYSNINDNAKWILVIIMIIGRLEIFTILILFTKNFWRK